jgi:4-amino-4-deoxy-L-arabinose transferase-like glycosyltransferase
MHSKHLPIVHVILIAIVAVYVVIGALYAALTPAWQVPDEPAHYNYVRALAEDGSFPVLEPGDYDQAYNSRLTSEHFAPQLSIAPLEYEDHQPPLYYLLAAPVYRLFDGALLPLRLLSVLMGAGLLLVAFVTVRAVFPARPELALMAAAFIAFIPQHVAMTAGVENDVLAELLIGATLWALVIYVGGDGERGRPWPLGLLLAAVLLTKTTVYLVVGVAALAVAIRWRRERRTWKWALGQLVCMFVPAALLSAPWFIRNGLTYGWLDPLGLARHDQVVVGQMRTSEYLALEGWAAYWERAWNFTFQSFWGQFGWMAVVLPTRLYQALLLFSVLLGSGFAWWLFDRRRPRLTPTQRTGLTLFLVTAALTMLQYVGYNLTFVQHQGRYLFYALIPIGTAATLGLGALASLFPERMRAWAMAAPFAGLAVLDVYCLFKFIIPFLAR